MQSENNHLRGYFDEDLSMNSPISTCMPSKLGRGQSALLFTDFIIQQQNDLLVKCKEMLKKKKKAYPE